MSTPCWCFGRVASLLTLIEEDIEEAEAATFCGVEDLVEDDVDTRVVDDRAFAREAVDSTIVFPVKEVEPDLDLAEVLWSSSRGLLACGTSLLCSSAGSSCFCGPAEVAVAATGETLAVGGGAEKGIRGPAPDEAASLVGFFISDGDCTLLGAFFCLSAFGMVSKHVRSRFCATDDGLEFLLFVPQNSLLVSLNDILPVLMLCQESAVVIL